MKCVGYDEQFMFRLLPATVAEQGALESAHEEGSESGPPSGATRNVHKRRRDLNGRGRKSNEPDLDEDNETDGESEEGSFTYQCTGTKKRPRKVAKAISC